jgi:hypothetical protein
MKKWLEIIVAGIWLAVLASVGYAAVPQDPVNVIGNLIKSSQYELAQQRITEYLGSNPNDINVLMMQGNLILNERLAQGSANYTIFNESIYQKTNGYHQLAPLLIPQPVAVAVAEPWRKCLELDPNRVDIQESLAYLYAQALMKPELLAVLPHLQADAAQPEEEKYVLCTLAGMLAERNALAEAVEVYQAIIGLYPKEPVVYADLADTLLQSGRLAEAQQYLAKGAVLPGSDKKQLYWTTFKLEATLGNYPQALAALQALAKLTHKRDWQFYQGLLLYYQNKPQWVREMQAFLAAASDTTDQNDRALASFLLSKANRHDYASYQKSLTFKVDAAFLLLLHKRAMTRFPNQAEPLINYAEFHNTHHNYAEAQKTLTTLEARALITPDLAEPFHLQYAWALQNSPNKAKANQHWQKLFNAKDFFVKSAAVYFYGKNLLEAGNQPEAIKFFKMMASEAAQSKYAFYCQRLLLQLEREAATQLTAAPTPALTPTATPISTPTSTLIPTAERLPRL